MSVPADALTPSESAIPSQAAEPASSAAALPSLPPLAASDVQLLDLFLSREVGLCLYALAEHTQLSLTEMLAWARTPAVVAHIDAWLDVQRLHRVQRHAPKVDLALDALAKILSESPDPIEQRRAATLLTRTIARLVSPLPARKSSSRATSPRAVPARDPASPSSSDSASSTAIGPAAAVAASIPPSTAVHTAASAPLVPEHAHDADPDIHTPNRPAANLTEPAARAASSTRPAHRRPFFSFRRFLLPPAA